jgi:hypothetical protein
MIDIFAFTSVWIGIIMAVGLWIVWPIERIARRVRRPVRFSIADFLCLFISIQVPLGFTVWYNAEILDFALVDQEDQLAFVRIVAGIFFILGILIWWGGVRAISFCGIYDSPRRMLFLGVIVPTVYYGLLPFALSVIACVMAISNGDVHDLLTNRRWAGAVTVFVGCALLVCGVLVRKIVLANVPEVRELAESTTPETSS